MKPVKEIAARTLKLFLLVENRLLREALAGIMRKQPDFSIVGVDRYTPSIEKAVVESRPDILVADHASAMTFPANLLPGSLSVMPEMKIVFFGMEEEPEIFL